MNEEQLPQLIDFLQQAIACCRSSASFAHIPAVARARLQDASNNVEFFLQRHEYSRAFAEARQATAVNAAVVRYIQSSADAAALLIEELESTSE
jgi:hypothetical protein